MKDWFKRHKEQSVIFLLLISLAGACYFEPSLFLDEELREMQEEERREEELIRFRCSCSCRLCEDCQGMSSQDFHNDDVHCRCSCDVCEEDYWNDDDDDDEQDDEDEDYWDDDDEED